MDTIKNWLAQTLRILFLFATTLAIVYLFQVVLKEYVADYVSNEIDNTGTYLVTNVFDGDTIEVQSGDTKERVRLIGVDTPETGGNGTDVECYGHEATAYLREALQGRRVTLESDPINSSRDRYDRLLRYVYRDDGLDVNLEILKGGYSPEYSVFPLSRQADFADAVADAKSRNAGLWAACSTGLGQPIPQRAS